MPNSFYNHGSFPATGSAATSASMRAELQLIAAGFDKLPTLAGNNNRLVVVNGTGTGLTAVATLPAINANDSDFLIQDNADNSKKFRFEASSIAIGTTRVFTMPNANTTLVGTDTTQTLTNKTLTTPIIAQISNTGTLTLPTSTDTLVGRATTDTLTNKTLTAPVIATIVNTGTLTLPTSTDTLVGRATTDTLTNKSISGSSNTLTNIANGSLVNSSVTIGSTNLSLGGTMTTLSGVTISGSSNTLTNIANASLTNSSVTIGSTNIALGATATTVAGLTLTGAAVNGTVGATTPSTGAFTTISTSGAATLASGTVNGAAIVNISDSQTLTNKSISGSANTITNIGNASLVNSGLTINGVNIALGGTATITAANPQALTVGTGLQLSSGTTYDGSAARTINIDATVATLTGTQTLTNKTINLTSNTLVATSAQIAAAVTDETGSGSLVFATSPTLVTPTLGAASATSVAFGAGAVGTPSITATGDLDTGIFFPAADTIAFTEGGVEAMRIDSSGNVGIGTSSPSTKLEISGTGSQFLTVTRTDASIAGSIQLIGGSSLNALRSVGAKPLAFDTNSTERMRIDSSGNVGIGTSSPTDLLSVGTLGTTAAPIITIGSTTTGSGSIYFGDGTGSGRYRGYMEYIHTSDYMAFGTAATERMRIDSSGNVFVGATTGSYKFEVTAATDIAQFIATDAGASGAQVQLFHNSASPANNDVTSLINFAGMDSAAQATIYSRISGISTNVTNGSESGAIAFSTRNTGTFAERLRIDASGNVGIGTSSPSGILHATTSGALGTTSLFERTTSSTDTYFIASRTLATTSGDMVDGFGVSHTFNIRDSANVINPIAAVGARRSGADDSGALTFYTYSSGSESERMRIDSSGNVGIGTTGSIKPLSVEITSARSATTDNEAIRVSYGTNSGVQQSVSIGFATGVSQTYPAAKIELLEFDAVDDPW